MAQKFRKVDPRVWDDEKFQNLNPMDKLVAVYCLTNSQCNRIGLYRFSIGRASEDLGIEPGEVRDRLDTVCHTLFWVFDDKSRVLYLPTWWKYNKPDNRKALIGYLEDIHDLPQTHLIKDFRTNITYLPDTVSDTVCDRVSPQEKEKEQEKERDKKISVPPSLEEVKAYCLERNNGIDPERFMAYYETNGWTQGKTAKPIRSWKHAVIYWERNGKSPPPESRLPTPEQDAEWNPHTEAE